MDNGASSYRRFLDGDDNSFVEIIKDYKDGLIFYLNGFVGNIHIAEDLTEDTFVKIVTKKPKYNGKASFKTWLYAIGRNVALDYLKHSKKFAAVSAEDCLERTDEEDSLEQAYIREERKIAVHKVLRKLKPEYRQVLWLIYFEGFSNKETAAVMKRSVHSVETLVYRARQTLKAELYKEGFIDENLL